MPAQILIVDDDPEQRSDLENIVSALGYSVTTAADGREALDKLENAPVNVILTDLMMPGIDGFALLKELNERGDCTPAIVLTAFGSIDQAISVVHNLKAFWFLEKPVQPGVMRTLLDRAIHQQVLQTETERLKCLLSYQGVLGELVGESPAMREIFSLIRQVAPTSASVLISGESGTGKELVARAIHNLSPRGDAPFVAVNCAALPESLMESELFGHEKGAFTGAVTRRAGCFEQAHNGTLLLDEIGEMPIATQAKLLRVIEESKVRRLGGTVDIPVAVRVLAATNRVPELAVQNRQLREDLYYRLNVFHLTLPPLRERRQDIGPIAQALISNLNRKHGCRVTGISSEVLQRFSDNSWPGNVRELRNLVERSVILAREGEIQLHHLPRPISQAPEAAAAPPAQPACAECLQVPVGRSMAEVEEAYIRLTLKHARDNKSRTAEMLGFCLRTLHNKLRSYEKGKAQTASMGGGE